MVSISGRPKTLVDFSFYKPWRKRNYLRQSASEHIDMLGKLYKGAGGTLHGSLVPVNTLQDWERRGRGSSEFLQQLSKSASARENEEPWKELMPILDQALGREKAPEKQPAAKQTEPQEPLSLDSLRSLPNPISNGATDGQWTLPERYSIPGYKEQRDNQQQADYQERLRLQGDETKLRTRLVRQLKMDGLVQEFTEALLAGQPSEDKTPGFHPVDPEADAALESGFLRGISLLPNSAEYLDLSPDSIQKLKWELG